MQILTYTQTFYYSRCDILTDTSEQPICQHCKQYGFECTFFLPITETRFKKKRLEEEASAAAADKATKDSETPQKSPQSEHPKGEVRIYGGFLPLYLIFFLCSHLP